MEPHTTLLLKSHIVRGFVGVRRSAGPIGVQHILQNWNVEGSERIASDRLSVFGAVELPER